MVRAAGCRGAGAPPAEARLSITVRGSVRVYCGSIWGSFADPVKHRYAAGAGLALSAPRSELDAALQRGARPPDDRHEDRHRQIAEGEERDRDQHGRPGPHAAEVAELHRQYLRRDAFGAIQEERDLLG